MDFRTILIDDIYIKKSVKNSYDIKLNNKTIEFITPELYVPFGIENKFNNYFLNLELIKTRDENVELFQYFIESLESKLIDLLEIPNNIFNSQLRITDNNVLVYTKLFQRNNKILTNFKSKENENLNIFSLQKKTYVKLILIIDKLWNYNEKFYYKFKIKEIILC